MASIPRIRLTGRAARFLQMLQELGHLDEESLQEVLLSLHVPRPGKAAALADLDAVRSAAAFVIVQQLDGAEIDGALRDDWALLFS